ncbi:MAG: CAP domain-containing protein [Pseudomonadota bacterium]
MVSALAFAVLSHTASAAVLDGDTAPCDLENGYASSPAAFAEEVDACMGAFPNSSVIATETQISGLSERHRAQYGLEPLAQRDSLQRAARAHAMDMAARGYASHQSPEGLDHSDRLRRLDRTALFGTTGANIAVLDAGSSAIAAFNVMISDPVNAENLRRTTFSHSGVGVAETEDGAIIVVQLFAKVDALLEAPLPHIVDSRQATSVKFVDTDFSAETLKLTSARDGRTTQVAHAIVPARHRAGDASLLLEASLGTATFTLHGPVVTIAN